MKNSMLGRLFLGLTLWVSLSSVFGRDKISTDLQNLEWTEEGAQVLTRLGKAALELKDVEWKHAQSEHFIYHFTIPWMAERAAGEAEIFYSMIKEGLQIEKDEWEIKGHIFLFDQESLWGKFVEKQGVDRWSGGFHRKGEIFIPSTPNPYPFIGSTLCHEMTHLVIQRFVKGSVPTWLEEGVAESMARNCFQAYARGRNYRFIFEPFQVMEADYLPLREVVSGYDYPENPEKVSFFYAEALSLVKFFMENYPKIGFLEFLQEMADGKTSDTAFEKTYGTRFNNFEALEKDFRKFAITADRTAAVSSVNEKKESQSEASDLSGNDKVEASTND
jgi:hypothetical protein